MKILYDTCAEPDDIVADCFSDDKWQIPFRISFSNREQQERQSLLDSLNGISLMKGNRIIVVGG